LNPNGLLDSDFGAGGKVVTDLGGNDAIYSLALQPDGKIIAGGATNASGPYIFALVRYDAEDGSTDTSFGSGGRVTTQFGPATNDVIYEGGLALEPSGKIVAG